MIARLIMSAWRLALIVTTVFQAVAAAGELLTGGESTSHTALALAASACLLTTRDAPGVWTRSRQPRTDRAVEQEGLN